MAQLVTPCAGDCIVSEVVPLDATVTRKKKEKSIVISSFKAPARKPPWYPFVSFFSPSPQFSHMNTYNEGIAKRRNNNKKKQVTWCQVHWCRFVPLNARNNCFFLATDISSSPEQYRSYVFSFVYDYFLTDQNKKRGKSIRDLKTHFFFHMNDIYIIDDSSVTF